MKLSPLHEEIAALLSSIETVTLPPAAKEEPEGFTKAGILPFLPAPTIKNWHFLVMKPVSRHPELPPPPFQLCKGTRMIHTSEGWKDMKDGMAATSHSEDLEVTAIREGVEELGLMLPGIRELYDLGPVSFTSASKGNEKKMWFFAAELRSEHDLICAEKIADTTAERRWLRLDQFESEGREDHLPILKRAAMLLHRHLK